MSDAGPTTWWGHENHMCCGDEAGPGEGYEPYILKRDYDALSARVRELEQSELIQKEFAQDQENKIAELEAEKQQLLDAKETEVADAIKLGQLLTEAKTLALERQVESLRKESIDEIQGWVVAYNEMKSRLAECEKKCEWLEGAMHEQRRERNIEYQRAEELNREVAKLRQDLSGINTGTRLAELTNLQEKLAAAEAELSEYSEAIMSYRERVAKFHTIAKDWQQWCERLAEALERASREVNPNTVEIYNALNGFEAWKKERGG